ncbi:hypothetical protein L226DRAFT_491083 [Lentinus tigrinus ALCF2SS1-7]|uniref:Uncharacterized protein n=1 Tax=Lentinus tigrinus ALCF2SS1-6 TaxID=1328759 RepID=A0A5C2S0M3_9APHY|nr:hypothetical protein L227DRAFT_552810 [Lentinus tigrinus ALCF2SS1-6]RPD71746.1 hypothetical protein L226DRAFT_491083 [Lentinus tigrinus ALCF2SS1-7]
MSTQSQYAGASAVPLIKSPSLRLPRPVEHPPDIHPLPDSVTAYFVYPFTLEPHVLTVEASRRSTLAAHAARREAYLKAREEEKERRKREALRRIAPGFEPSSTPLVPTKRFSGVPNVPGSTTSGDDSGHRRTKSVMEDLVDQLAALESK